MNVNTAVSDKPDVLGEFHSHNYFNALFPDETMIEIATWFEKAQDLAHLSGTNRRFRNLFCQKTSPAFHKILNDRHIPSTMQTWEHVAWYQRVKEFGLLEENRIGFAMGSLAIDIPEVRRGNMARGFHFEDMDPDVDSDSDSDSTLNGMEFRIIGIRQRISNVCTLLGEFPKMTLDIESHCGAAGPPDIAKRFSHVRGMFIVEELARNMPDSLPFSEMYIDHRVTVRGWGQAISNRAAAADISLLNTDGGRMHSYVSLAQQGLGWVEIYLKFDGIQQSIPDHPHFYSGIGYEQEEEDSSLPNQNVDVRMFQVVIHDDMDLSSNDDGSMEDEDGSGTDAEIGDY